MIDPYEQGKQDRNAWDNSPQYAQFDRNTPVRDIMRLFLPAVPEDMMQVARPLPSSYSEWMKGFRDGGD